MIAYRYLLAACVALAAADAQAQAPWQPAVRPAGRLHGAQLGLVINSADPYSVAVGEYYAARRKLAPEQVLRLELPVRPELATEDFERLRAAIAERFGPRIQALALAWTQPYAVQCHAITGALALGVDPGLCRRSCAATTPSRYFNAATARPFTDLGWRPSMLLAAPDVESAKALVDRGLAADGSLLLRGRPPATAFYVTTQDAARRVRTALYPPPGPLRGAGIDVRVDGPAALADARHVLLVQTGSVKLDLPPRMDWLPGALADHLTSAGGALAGGHGQSTALEWIASGATASYGTVSEPCNHLQKFPHPQVLLQAYVQGATAIEAYWKSVAWPAQGLFIGDPLAAPFSR